MYVTYLYCTYLSIYVVSITYIVSYSYSLYLSVTNFLNNSFSLTKPLSLSLPLSLRCGFLEKLECRVFQVCASLTDRAHLRGTSPEPTKVLLLDSEHKV